MEKRIELESRGKNASEVKDLNLDNCRSTSVVGLDDYVNLESLSLINVGLTSLKSFPKLPNLKRLELSDNRISNGLNFLSGSPKLTYLNLSGNKIVNLETLEPLKGFTKLKNLDLFNNEVTSMDAYRTEVFNLIPTLKYLDGYDQEDHEAEDSDGEEEDINGNDDSSDDEAGSDFMEEEDDDDEEEDISLSAVYNDNLEEESSDDQYEANYDVDEEDEDLDETEDGENNDENQVDPEESTRGKKRKHDDESESNN